MMLLASAALMTLSSCSNDMDEFFDESAAERLNRTQAKYTDLLTSSKNGWAFEYYPTGSADDGCVLYAVKFFKDGSVDVAGDPFGSGVVSNEISMWDILTDNGPTLSFSTYNKLIHQFSDPGDDGMGYEGDYEFAFVYSDTENPDSVVMLKGKKRGLYSRLKMIDEEVTPEEYLQDCQAKQSGLFPETMRNYLILHIGNDLVRMDDMKTGVPDTYIYGKDKVLFGKPNSYIFVKYSGNYYARFNEAFKASEGELTEKNFRYNEGTQEFVGVDNPDIRITAPNLATFVVDEALSGALTWSLARNSKMNESFKSVWDAASSALTKKGYTIDRCIFSNTKTDETCNATLTLRYKRRSTTIEMLFKFNISFDGDNVSLQYVGPLDDGAGNFLNNLPECATLVNAFAGTYTVDNNNANKFLINALQLNKDNGMSFEMTANYAVEADTDK